MPTVAELIGRDERRKVRDAVASSRPELGGMFVPIAVKAAKADEDDDGRLFFEGYANTRNIDRTGDIIEPRAFRRSLKGFLKNNPQLLYMHDWYTSVGGIVDAKIDENGLWVRGYVQPAEDDKGEPLRGGFGEYIRFVRGQVKRGELRTLSIGFRILETKQSKERDPITGKDIDVRVITNLELYEISLVTIPANRESVVSVRSAFAERYGDDVARALVSPAENDDESRSSDDLRELVKQCVADALDELRKENDDYDDAPAHGEAFRLVDVNEDDHEQFILVSLEEENER